MNLADDISSKPAVSLDRWRFGQFEVDLAKLRQTLTEPALAAFCQPPLLFSVL
jgi:hypothetical protein